MLGFFRKKKPLVAPSPLPPEERPEVIARFADYVALASELELASLRGGGVLAQQVIDFLWDNGLPPYDFEEVIEYLGRSADREGDIFCWRPLRERDVPAMEGAEEWGWGDEEEHNYHRGGLFPNISTYGHVFTPIR